ncbi:UNVERIFIED_CONTAM: hypothetical protein FKN15_047945, partial [Acipenser sinensis]
TGRIDPHYPKVCGHQGNVLDIKWNPFIDNIIASCSEDTSHSTNLLFLHQILIWNLDIGEPVKMIDCHSDVILCMSFNTDGSLVATSCKDKKLRVIEPRSGRVLQEANCKNHKVNRVVFLGNMKRLLTTGVSRWNTRQIALWDQEDLSMPMIEEEIDGLSGLLFPFYDADTHMLYLAGKILIWNLDIGEPVKMIDCHSDVILCMSFNTDGSLVATSCKDKKLRVIEPRSGRVLQEANCKNHKVNRVVFLGNMKRLLTTGVSRWNTRQIALWDQEDLSMPMIEEEIDGLSGLLFPFYDADTHMLYLAGKGDGNIRYYEMGTEKPYLQYLLEFRSPAPQKGLGVMPKHGLDVSACEVFRFYKLFTLKGLIEPVSMIVPRRSETYQEDIYPMTPGMEPALSAGEWLSGINRDPVLMSLKEGYKKPSNLVFKAPVKEKRSVVVNGIDLLENVPPRTENELLRVFFRQQDELRRLKDELSRKDVKIQQLELELKNLKNSPKPM